MTANVYTRHKVNPALELWLILGTSLLIVFVTLRDDGMEDPDQEAASSTGERSKPPHRAEMAHGGVGTRDGSAG